MNIFVEIKDESGNIITNAVVINPPYYEAPFLVGEDVYFLSVWDEFSRKHKEWLDDEKKKNS